MEPVDPRRRLASRGRKRPVEEAESPFPLSEKPLPEKKSVRGKLFLLGASLPLLVAVLFLGALIFQGRKLIYAEVYPPLLFQQVVEGKTMERVLEFLGPPKRLGETGHVNQWIYEPGIFDFSLYPYLPWETPIMNGKIVRDAGLNKSPRRILVRFESGKEVPPDKEGASRPRDKSPDPTANVKFEY